MDRAECAILVGFAIWGGVVFFFLVGILLALLRAVVHGAIAAVRWILQLPRLAVLGVIAVVQCILDLPRLAVCGIVAVPRWIARTRRRKRKEFYFNVLRSALREWDEPGDEESTPEQAILPYRNTEEPPEPALPRRAAGD